MDPTNAGTPSLPDVQAPNGAATVPDQANPTTPSNDGSGAAKDVANAELVARIERASIAAVDQHLNEQPAKARKRGQRGPDRNPGARPSRARPVPLETLDAVPDPALLAEEQPVPLAPPALELPPEPPPFDREAAGEMAAFATEFLNDIAGVAMESWALKHLGDEQLAEHAAAKARMTVKLQERWEKSLVRLAEKHRLALEWAPEIIAGGCLLVWGSNLRKQAVAIKMTGQQLRDPANATLEAVRNLSEHPGVWDPLKDAA